MANKRLIKVLKVAFSVHVIIALMVVFFNPYIGVSVSRLYLRYVVPGPFFSEGSITSSHHLTVSWSDANGWTSPLNPALEAFHQFQSSHNSYFLNKCRFERSFLYGMMRKRNADILKSREWKLFQRYLTDKIVPVKADSIGVEIYQCSPFKNDTVLLRTKWRNRQLLLKPVATIN